MSNPLKSREYPCEQALAVYNKFIEIYKNKYEFIKPTGSILKCMEGKTTTVHDIDVVVKTRKQQLGYVVIELDGIPIHVIFYHPKIHEPCINMSTSDEMYKCFEEKFKTTIEINHIKGE